MTPLVWNLDRWYSRDGAEDMLGYYLGLGPAFLVEHPEGRGFGVLYYAPSVADWHAEATDAFGA